MWMEHIFKMIMVLRCIKPSPLHHVVNHVVPEVGSSEAVDGTRDVNLVGTEHVRGRPQWCLRTLITKQ